MPYARVERAASAARNRASSCAIRRCGEAVAETRRRRAGENPPAEDLVAAAGTANCASSTRQSRYFDAGSGASAAIAISTSSARARPCSAARPRSRSRAGSKSGCACRRSRSPRGSCAARPRCRSPSRRSAAAWACPRRDRRRCSCRTPRSSRRSRARRRRAGTPGRDAVRRPRAPARRAASLPASIAPIRVPASNSFAVLR